MNIRRNFGTVALVLAMAAGTAGATLLAGEVSADAKPATQKIVVRPVDSHRHAAKGYRVKVENRSVACDSPSTAAIDYGILACGSSADYTVSCWHSSDKHRVLCLPDPTKKRLESIRLEGKFPKLRPLHHPQPQALRLANGQKWLVRDGGAAAPLKQHPSWVAAYYRPGHPSNAIYGPSGHPINTKHARHFVTTFANADAKGKRHDVTKAYYVGTGPDPRRSRSRRSPGVGGT